MRLLTFVAFLATTLVATVHAECKTDVQTIEINDPNVDLNILEEINVLVDEGAAELEVNFEEIEGTKLKLRVVAQYEDSQVTVGDLSAISFDAEAQQLQHNLKVTSLEQTGSSSRVLPQVGFAAFTAAIATAHEGRRGGLAVAAALSIAGAALPGCTAQEDCPTKFTVTIMYPRGSRWANQEVVQGDKNTKVSPPVFGKPCFQDPICKRRGGKCVMRRQDCPDTHFFAGRLCGNDPSNPFFSDSASPLGCGCCIPATLDPTPKPTARPTRVIEPVCVSDEDKCRLNDGWCVRHPVMCPSTHFFDQDLCRVNDPFIDQVSTCGCCRRIVAEPTPKPTRPVLTEAPTVEAGVCDFREDVCKEKGGKCVTSIEECPSSVGLFVEQLCRDPDQPNSRCGCCIRHDTPPPTLPPIAPAPCFQDQRCPELFKFGRCVKNKYECPPNWIFDPHFCHRDTEADSFFDILITVNIKKQCGCCYPDLNQPTRKPTARPTRSPEASQGECPLDDVCSQNNGFCVDDPEKCPQDNQHFLDPDLCKNPDGSGECQCCRKHEYTPPPTVGLPCLEDQRCNEEGGKCVESKDQCDEAAGFEFDTSKCNSYQSHNDPDKCGCCKPKSTPPPNTPPPTFEECDESPRCEETNGKCVEKREDCPEDMIFNPQLCRKVDADGTLVGDCGCCSPRPTERPSAPPTEPPTVGEPCIEDSTCKEKPGGFCVPDFRSCPSDMTYDPRFCSSGQSDEPNSCGCCYRDEPEPTAKPTPFPTTEDCRDDDICTSQNGFCFENSADNAKRCEEEQGGVVFSKLCGLDEKCACCIRATETPAPSPKPTQHPVQQCVPEDEECAAKGGRCVRVEADCQEFELFNPKLCNRDGEFDPNNPCGCCVPREQTKAPTLPEPCQEDDTCKRQGGRCVKDYREECDPDLHVIEREKCSADPTSATNTCACCTPRAPPTPPPTTQTCSVNAEKCSLLNGFCLPVTQRCPASFWSSKEYCNEDPTNPVCQCCIPIQTRAPTKQPTRPPQQEPCFKDERCQKYLGGFCVKDTRQCPDNMFFTPRFCRKTDAAGNVVPSECGCCYPPRVTDAPTPEHVPCKEDDQCKSSDTVEQKCVASKEECPVDEGFFFDQSRCTTDGNQECGCCGRKIDVPEPCADDPKCSFNQGFCFEVTEESKKKCTENNLVIDPDMCGATDTCACCRPEAQTEPPTFPEPCFEDDRCRERDGKCVATPDDCKLEGYFYNSELCSKDPSTKQCGCCMKG